MLINCEGGWTVLQNTSDEWLCRKCNEEGTLFQEESLFNQTALLIEYFWRTRSWVQLKFHRTEEGEDIRVVIDEKQTLSPLNCPWHSSTPLLVTSLSIKLNSVCTSGRVKCLFGGLPRHSLIHTTMTRFMWHQSQGRLFILPRQSFTLKIDQK